MNSLLKAIVLSIVISTNVFARGDVDVIISGGAAGATNATTQAFMVSLKEQGYNPNIIIGGNCKNAPALYEKSNKPTILMMSLDHLVFADVSNKCGKVNLNDFVAIANKTFHIVCGPNGSTYESFKAETGEVLISSEIGTTAKAVVGYLGKESGVKLKHVMYEGSGNAVKAMISGEVKYTATWTDKIVDLVKAGKASCFATANTEEVLNAKPLTKLFPNSKADLSGAIGSVNFIAKNLDKDELKKAINIAFKSPAVQTLHKERYLVSIPEIKGDNHQKIFNEWFKNNENMFKEYGDK